MILIPKFQNIIECGGTLQIAHFGPDGKLIEERMYSNIVTTIGKAWIAARMRTSNAVSPAGIPAEMGFMAVGGRNSGGTANDGLGTNPTKTTPLIGDQALTAASPLSELARVAVNVDLGAVSGAVVTYAAAFPAGTGTGALIEAGIFNVASGPVQGAGTPAAAMLCKTSYDVVNKAANDSIAITWTVTIQ